MENIYKTQTPGQFPFVASQLFNDDSSLTATQKQEKLAKVAQTAVDCGFNLALQSVGMSTITPLLQGLEGSGLKMIIGNGSLTEEAHCKNFVNGFKSYSSLAGWYLARLPRLSEIPTIKDFYNRILDYDPDHLIYMQLLEGLSSAYTGNCYSYLDYLRFLQGNDYFVNNNGVKELIEQEDNTAGIRPMIWSNKFDPVSYKSSGQVVIYYADFYKNLRYLRQISLESGHPFWAFCQCEKVADQGSYRQGTPASMRLMCYSALAYGAQGLVFSSYQQRPSSSSQTISNAPIDIYGKQTEMWYTVRSLIAGIKSLSHIFLGGEPTDIRHSGNLGIENFNYGTGSAFGPCDSISAGTKGVLHVLFQNKDRRYLIIVNHDIESSQSVTLKFNKTQKVIEETPLTILTPSSTTIATNSGLTVTRSLEPGGWAIFRYE